jgi:hypothetical protein
MRTIERLEINHKTVPRDNVERQTEFFQRLKSHKVLFLIISVILAFSIRVYKLDAAGFSEDETNKIFALRVYAQGDFTVNAEHPMLMKLLCFASTRMATSWNQAVGDRWGLNLSEETALRLPNALFGALTVIPILLLATALLGFETGVIASLLWTFGLNAIWFNRIGKEDTLLLFFMLMGFYFYNRAKACAAENIAQQERLYALAGAAFGLMLCSKYFPHYLGLNALFYTIVGYNSRNNRPLTRSMWVNYLGALALVFIIFNPVVFFPQTLRYIWSFLHEELLTHHGYLVGDTVFKNDMAETPFGTPWYFYWLYLAIKVPLPILIAFLAGLFQIVRNRDAKNVARGYLFLRFMLIFWLVPMTIIGAKFLRYTLSLMPLIYMTAAVGIITMWRWLANGLQRFFLDVTLVNKLAGVAVALVFIILPGTLPLFLGMPYPSLYMNAMDNKRPGYFFPHDEFYDLGARESIKYVAENAPPNATIASEIPGVVQYYLERYQRTDIQSKILSQPEFSLKQERLDYVLLQRGRIYFENVENFRLIEKGYPLVQWSSYNGVMATQVYKISGL